MSVDTAIVASCTSSIRDADQIPLDSFMNKRNKSVNDEAEREIERLPRGTHTHALNDA
jgi:hypothetical protein